tara:strand:- start:5530 stop:9849 length:4320 start_codon:yes stop_codon:yes gene_type:complete
MAAVWTADQLATYKDLVKKCAIDHPVDKSAEYGGDLNTYRRSACPWKSLTSEQKAAHPEITSHTAYNRAAFAAPAAAAAAAKFAGVKENIAKAFYDQRGPVIKAAKAYIEEIEKLRTRNYDALLNALGTGTPDGEETAAWLRNEGSDGFGEGLFSPQGDGRSAFSGAALKPPPYPGETGMVKGTNFPGWPNGSSGKAPNFAEGDSAVIQSVYGLKWDVERDTFRGHNWKTWFPGMPTDYTELTKRGLPPDARAKWSAGNISTFEEGYPHLWATNLGMILGQLRALLVSRDFKQGALNAAGGSFTESAVKQLQGQGGSVSDAFADIFHWNHGWVPGLLGFDTGGGMVSQASTMTTCAIYKITAPFNAFYVNHVGINQWMSTLDDPVVASAKQGSAYTSIDGILNSGGPYMQTQELGKNETKWENKGYGGLSYGPWGGTQHDTKIFADADDESGGWSLIANAKRAMRHGKMFKNIKPYEKHGSNLMMVGQAVLRIAITLRKQSAAIVEIHQDLMEKTCKIAKDYTDELPDLQNPFWPDGGKNDAADAQAALDLANVQYDLEEAFYGSDREALLFKEQCFLLTFISPLAAHKKNVLDRKKDPKVFKKLPYSVKDFNDNALETNSTILFDGDPYAFLNRLTQNPKAAALHNAMPHEISNLQPFIRLYKVIFDDDGNEQEVEIAFNSHFSQDELEIFKTTKNRGVGSGLKSFNFTYDGSNPFSVKKSIKANLKIFANSFGELHRTRNDKTGAPYSYLDLAMKTWNTAPGQETKGTAHCDIKIPNPLEENIKNSELNFRLKAKVGLSVPPGDYSSISTELLKALKESFVTLQLTPTVHNFEFDEMGRVTFNLNFLAYIEQFFDQKMFNVFAEPQVTKERFRREFKMKNFKKSCKQEEIDQQKKDYGNVAQRETGRSISSLLSKMMVSDLIYYIDMPYSVIKTFLLEGPYADYEEMKAAMIPRQSKDQNDLLKENIAAAMKGAFNAKDVNGDDDSGTKRQQIAAALVGSDPSRTSMGYFYLSELMDTILMNIEAELEYFTAEGLEAIMEDDEDIDCRDVNQRKRELKSAAASFKKLRFLLGPLEITHPQATDGKNSMWVNLGDIPVSVKYFAEWLADKMLSKDEVFYPLTKFMNDLLNDLVRNFLNNDSCFGYSVKQKTRVQQAAITGYGKSTKFDPITQRLIDLNSEATSFTYSTSADLEPKKGARPRGRTLAMRADMKDFKEMSPIINPSGPSNSPRSSIPLANAYNYFVFFAGRTMPVEKMNGNKAADEAIGIFHYTLGRDRGLLKNIKLTKTETKGLAEVRFEQDGYDGLEQLRVIYDAQVDMFANVSAFPGTYVFIDPRGFAPDMSVGLGKGEFGLTKLGIGGYYMIIRSEHEFAEGRANTILHTKWVNQIGGQDDSNDEEISSTFGTGETTSGRCSIELRPDPNEESADGDGDGSWIPFT